MKTNKKQRMELVIKGFDEIYPNPECQLLYSKPYELIIAGRLSAQCTDSRVNTVTPILFDRFPTLESFAKADVKDIEEIIKPCGLYKTKAKSIKEMATQLIEKYNGEIPQSIEELTTLSGIGRKTANLIMGDIFNKPAIVTDTHFIRITGRLGFTKSTDPIKVEAELRKIVPPNISARFCHQIVMFGREYCKARAPRCTECNLNEFCPNFNK